MKHLKKRAPLRFAVTFTQATVASSLAAPLPPGIGLHHSLGDAGNGYRKFLKCRILGLDSSVCHNNKTIVICRKQNN